MCEVCGFVFHSDKKRVMWNGLVVDPKCYEVRHPQDFIRGKKDQQAVDNPAPEPGNILLAVTSVTVDNFNPSITPSAKSAITFLDIGDVTADDL